MHIVERIARDITATHYVERFKKDRDNPHVQINVDGNWSAIGLPQVVAVLACMEAHGLPVPEGYAEFGHSWPDASAKED